MASTGKEKARRNSRMRSAPASSTATASCSSMPSTYAGTTGGRCSGTHSKRRKPWLPTPSRATRGARVSPKQENRDGMKVTLAKFCDYACTVDGGKNALIGLFDTIGGEQY